MSKKTIHRHRVGPRRVRSRSGASDCRATVVGLGAVGRQTARLLAALGVQSLQLADPRIVARRKQKAEAYEFTDIGRMRAHATAAVCHQIDPTIEVNAVTKRSLKGIDLSDAVFCCPATASLTRQLSGAASRRVRFVASCRVMGTAAHLDFGLGITPIRDWLKSQSSDPVTRIQIASAEQPHVASIAAGLLVGEFVRFVGGEQPRLAVRIDLEDLSLTFEETR